WTGVSGHTGHRGKADAGMGMARYVVDAVLLEGRSAREVARAHRISKTWIYELISRYRAGGYEALELRSRRPHSCKHETSRELWQVDITAWQLADGKVVEILNQLDDHSRLHLGCDAYERVKAADVVRSFHEAAELHGLPASLLSDNGAVFVGGYRRGKVLLEYELERLGIQFKNS